MSDQGILLESGNNEMELLEFYLADQSFGLNVAKVRQLVPYHPDKVIALPESDKFVMGSFVWLDQTIVLVDLAGAMGIEPKEQEQTRVILVTEFNGDVTAFLVDGVNRIHRISWDVIQPTNNYIGQFHVPIVATANIEDHDVQMIDLERIMMEVSPSSSTLDKLLSERRLPTDGKTPDQLKVMFAEDSSSIKELVLRLLGDAGYTNVTAFDNGAGAFESLASFKKQASDEGKKLKDYVDLVISDIEMPQMDGLTLCKRIKTELEDELPVILYSSLISDAMSLKCESVGADGNVSKSDAVGLIRMIDDMLLAA